MFCGGKGEQLVPNHGVHLSCPGSGAGRADKRLPPKLELGNPRDGV